MTTSVKVKETTVANAKDEADGVEYHRMGMNEGNVLFLLAGKYRNLLLKIVEMVQNTIDARATQVLVAIDQQEHRVIVADNGTGASIAKFKLALLSVGDSSKQEDDLGKFGIGLISPLGMCDDFKFISRDANPKSSTFGDINSWHFVGKDIRGMKEVDVPRRSLKSLPTIPAPFRSAARRLKTEWSTIVWMEGTTKDRMLGAVSLDELEHKIRTKHAGGMLLRGTVVHIVINDEHGNVTYREVPPEKYTGEPLPVVEYDDVDAGKVRFELYRASKARNGKKGVISIKSGADLSRVPWEEFRRQASFNGYQSTFIEAFRVMGSGYFEGLITAEKLNMDPSRELFDTNDAWKATCFRIDDWFREHGQQYYEEEQEMAREKRYQEIGERAIEHLLDRVALDPYLNQVLEELQGIAPPPVPREPREPSADTKPPRKKRKRTEVEPKPRPPKDDDERDPKNRRQHAKLRFAYEQIRGYANVWRFEEDTMTLVFNTIHDQWVELDETGGKHDAKNSRQIMHLQLFIGLEVIQLLGQCLDDFASFHDRRDEIDRRIAPYVNVIINPMMK